MDDPLSAVDSHVAAHLMEKAIQGFLKKRNKTVLLALNQLQFLPNADKILFIKHRTHKTTLFWKTFGLIVWLLYRIHSWHGHFC